jgi:hypothetical protein
MSVEIVKNKADGIARTLGRAALHALSPNDFEYYACSFELISHDFTVLDIFHFPVMPNGISINGQSLVSIKKTGRSYLSQFNDSFVGKTISINGTFGRKFRLLLSTTKGQDLTTGRGGQFDLKVKTGYGALKLMENIIGQVYSVENRSPKLLIFNNMAFNQSLVVEVLSFNPTMSLENNMIWNYNLEMKAIGDANSIDLSNRSKGRLVDLLAADVINKTANDLFDDFKGEISSKTNLI